MDAPYSSEMSVYILGATVYYIPEGIALHNHRCENLILRTINFCLSSFSLRMLALTIEFSTVKEVDEMQIMQRSSSDKARELFNFLAFLIRNTVYDDQRLAKKE
jgi:hypothetical protein